MMFDDDVLYDATRKAGRGAENSDAFGQRGPTIPRDSDHLLSWIYSSFYVCIVVLGTQWNCIWGTLAKGNHGAALG